MGWLGLAMGLLICRSQLLPGTVNVAKTPDLRKLHPRVRVSYDLLIEHDIKLPSKYISLCLYICVALSSHQWTTQRQSVKEEKIKSVCISISHLLLRTHHGREQTFQGPDVGRTCYEGASFGNTIAKHLWTHLSCLSLLKICTGVVPWIFYHGKGKGSWGLISLPKRLLTVSGDYEAVIFFSDEITCGLRMLE